MHYDAFEDDDIPGECKSLDTSINSVSLEQYDEDNFRPNADLESRPPIRSREQLGYMYPD